MNKWIIKAIVQKVISWLPNSHVINFWFQKNITKGVELTDEHFNDKLVHCSDHIGLYVKDKSNFEINCLELGTGWYPVIPIGLFLAGANSIYSIDLTPLCNKDRLITTIDKYKVWYAKGKIEFYIPNLKLERWKILEELSLVDDFEKLLSELNIQLLIGDARNTNLDSLSIDYIVSNNVFEHIYPSLLNPILIEFKRLLKSDGKMSHFIDMSDHFAHNDSSITIYNYLKYSDRIWNIIDNSVQPQNRMRLPEYIELFDRMDFEYDFHRIRNGNIENFNKVKLNDKYSKLDSKELMISHVHTFMKL